MLPSLRMIAMSSPYHRPVAAVSATHSHATQNTDASVAGGIGIGITGITDVVLTQAPKFGGAPTAWPGPGSGAKFRFGAAWCIRPAKDTCVCVHVRA